MYASHLPINTFATSTYGEDTTPLSGLDFEDRHLDLHIEAALDLVLDGYRTRGVGLSSPGLSNGLA
jgi:hypothetical protein